MEPLSARNPNVQRLRRLSGRRRSRREEGAFVIDGPTLLTEALEAGIAPEVVFLDVTAADATRSLSALADLAAESGAVVHPVRGGVLEHATDVTTPQGIAAIAPVPAGDLERAVGAVRGFVLVLADVADPGNVGTILRTAEAAGADAVVVGAYGADPFAPKVVRASAGSVFRVPVAVAPVDDALAALEAGGVLLVGTGADGVRAYDELEPTWPVAVVLGNEAHGMSEEVRSRLDEVVAIPMAGAVESLNVATAAAVLCFDLARRRRER